MRNGKDSEVWEIILVHGISNITTMEKMADW